LDWLKNFLIPLAQLVFALSISLSFLGALSYGLYKRWIKTWKYKLKYGRLGKSKPREEDVLSIMRTDETKAQFHMRMLLENHDKHRVYEMLYLYDKIKPKEDINKHHDRQT